jgi:hypothetical protein
MAYGVKYRLEFSDVLGNGKKVEILQDGYTGDVLPMIGTGNPVQIKWESDDDFYKPIIGSSCTLNLIVTDDVSYDDFFRGNEEEYRVQIYYDRHMIDSFQDRVESTATNAGRIEVFECIENEFTQGNTITSDFRNRVRNDGGILENLDCIGNEITDSRTYDWAIFWEGFLYLDNYSEAITSTPYEISLQALDGLGLLDINDSRALNTLFVNPIVLGASFGEWYYISEMLQVFNMDSTAVERYLYCGVIEQYTGQTDILGDVPSRPWSTYSNIDDKFNFFNNKEVLENILRKSNSRIFHAFGDWYVVPNSIYLDEVFSDQYYDRNVFKNALSNGQNEIIEFQVFDVGNSRDFEGNATRNVTKRIKKDLQPINNDLVVEYLAPLNKVIINSDLKQVSNSFGMMSFNQGFTFGSQTYTVPYGSVSDNHEYVASNNQSYKLTSYVTSSSKVTALTQLGRDKKGNFNPADNVEYSFEYLFDSTATSVTYDLYYSVKVSYRFIPTSPATVKYFDKANNSMSSSIVYNEIQFRDARELKKWQKESSKLPKDNLLYNMKVEITFYFPEITSSSGYSAIYLDNIQSFDTTSSFDSQKLTSTISGNRGVYDFESIPNEENINAFIDTFYNPLIAIDDDKNTAQQILNDYRDFVPRYEGTFYGNKNKPISPLNKLHIDFDNLKEEQSGMIDTLNYNLRKNEFEVVSHIPNNDPDVNVSDQLLQN